jgi:outer membrane protein OmpA-like peptidoglycan-associated protein/tetratricopeptide (TPR) repeat protein
MRLNYCVIFSIMLFLVLQKVTYAQQPHDHHKKIEHEAKELFRAEEYVQALPLYLKLDSMIPNNAFYNYRAGLCYYNSHNKARCLPYLEKAKKLKYKDPDIDLYLGHACHLNHQFDQAIGYFQAYKDSTKVLAIHKEHHKEKEHNEIDDVDRDIEMCKVGKELVADSLDFVIENMGPKINTQYPEYVPVVSADEHVLIFTSRRPNTTGGGTDPGDNKYYEDIYISYKDANGQWQTPENLGNNVNTELHDANIGLSPDGHKLFIYRADFEKNSGGDIYVSTLQGKTWSVPVKMEGHINSKDWEPSATISADEKTIFFTSNRAGGFGGTDIYYAKMKPDGHWDEPINMGPEINTKYDEDAPYIHPDNKTLFFSSRGLRTMGGFDIFTTLWDDEKKQWGKPENAGYPINTADDDIYFIWSADGTKGYFSSWRQDTYGEKDLYVIHRPGGTSNLLVLKGNVYDHITKKPLGSKLTITNLETHEVEGTFMSNSETGKFVLALPHGNHLGIAVEANGYVFYSENYNYPASNPFFEVKKDIYLDPVKVNNVIQVGTTIVLKNIFFDFDLATLREVSKTELERLDKFLTENPDVEIEISGHTDDKGKDKYNQKLSERRAQSVVDYLVARSIDKKRLVAKGYGESKPVAANDTEENRQLNRRTELKIIGKK